MTRATKVLPCTICGEVRLAICYRRELGIQQIPAYSPQAKGRIERAWRTFQDRLVSELRLAGAATLAQANAVLEKFCADYNQRFARPAAEAVCDFRRLTRP